ncbi:hypothetical protein Tco_1163922 [Tanacetum coccineum]
MIDYGELCLDCSPPHIFTVHIALCVSNQSYVSGGNGRDESCGPPPHDRIVTVDETTCRVVAIEIMVTLGLPCFLSSSGRCLESVSKVVTGGDDCFHYTVGQACPESMLFALENFMDSPSKRRDIWELSFGGIYVLCVGQLCLFGIKPGRMSTPVFVDPESSTQADGAQSSRVPMPLPEDPYEAIRQDYLDGTDTESEPFEEPIDTETLESPLAIAPPISLSESTLPVLIPILRRTARMAVRVPHAMSSGLSTSMAEVAAMSESTLRKRFQSSYKSSLSVSPPNLPSQKRYRSMFELIEDSKDDDDEEDKEIEESMDSDNDEGHSVESDGLGLEEEEEAAPGGQQQAAPVAGTAVSAPLGHRHGALRHQSERPKRVSAFRQPTWTDPEDDMIYIDIPDYPPPAPLVQTPPSPEWTSGSLPISPSHYDVPSPISSPMIPLTIPSPVATPAAVKTEGFLTEYDRDIGELFTRSRQLGRRFSPRGQTDAQGVALWHAISDVQGYNRDLWLQLVEECRTAFAQFCPCVSALRLVARDRADIHILIRMWREM